MLRFNAAFKIELDNSNEAETECDLCGSPMVPWHCELICRNCGYRRDCTDS